MAGWRVLDLRGGSPLLAFLKIIIFKYPRRERTWRAKAGVGRDAWRHEGGKVPTVANRIRHP